MKSLINGLLAAALFFGFLAHCTGPKAEPASDVHINQPGERP